MQTYLKSNIKYNHWDYLIMTAIASLAYGNYELLGAIWPIRLIGAWGLVFVVNKYSWYKHSYFNGWTALLLFWCIWIVLSLIWTPDKVLGFTYTFHMFSMFGAMLLLFYAIQKSKRPFSSMALGWIIFLAITFPIAYWEITTGNHLPSGSYSAGQILGGEKRIFAAVTFQNLNSYVLMLTLLLPFLTTFILSKVCSNKFKLLLLISYLGATWILIINASRAGFICILLCSMLFTYFYYKKNKVVGKLILLLLSVVFIAWIIQNWSTLEFLIQIEERLNGKNSIFEDHTRASLIENGFKAFAYTFGIGGGIMSMNNLYANFTTSQILYAHNMALELLMEYGIVIPIVFFYFFYKALFHIKRVGTQESKLFFWYTFLSSLLMFTLDDCYQSRAGIWIYMGLLIGISGLPKDKWKMFSGIYEMKPINRNLEDRSNYGKCTCANVNL